MAKRLTKPASIRSDPWRSRKWNEIVRGRSFAPSDAPTIALLVSWVERRDVFVPASNPIANPTTSARASTGHMTRMQSLSIDAPRTGMKRGHPLGWPHAHDVIHCYPTRSTFVMSRTRTTRLNPPWPTSTVSFPSSSTSKSTTGPAIESVPVIGDT
jgi:hypothetical protein